MIGPLDIVERQQLVQSITRGLTTHTEDKDQDIRLSTPHTGNVINHKNEHAQNTIKVITKILVHYTSSSL